MYNQQTDKQIIQSKLNEGEDVLVKSEQFKSLIAKGFKPEPGIHTHNLDIIYCQYVIEGVGIRYGYFDINDLKLAEPVN